MTSRKSHLFCKIKYLKVINMTSWAINLTMKYLLSFSLTFFAIYKCSVSLFTELTYINWRRNYSSKMKMYSIILLKFLKLKRKWRDQINSATLFDKVSSMFINFYMKMHQKAFLSQQETIRIKAKTDKSFRVWEWQKIIAQETINALELQRINFCMKIIMIVKSIQTEA